MGRRPDLKSDEFCDANVILVVSIERISHLCLKPVTAKNKTQVVQFDLRRDPCTVQYSFLNFIMPHYTHDPYGTGTNGQIRVSSSGCTPPACAHMAESGDGTWHMRL